MTRCLIVDDDHDWQGRVLAYCSRLGLDYVAADNEDTAIEHCAAQMPDVVLVGTSSAPGFIRQLRRLGGKEPIVIHCPHKDDTEAVCQAIWNGASDYLVKPCSPRMFDAKLRQSGAL